MGVDREQRAILLLEQPGESLGGLAIDNDRSGRVLDWSRMVAVRSAVLIKGGTLPAVLSVEFPDRDGRDLGVLVIEPERLALPGIAREANETARGRDP
jgi:hypothetical protein